MIELEFVAARYRQPFNAAPSRSRTMFESGCFTEMLRKHPPYLAAHHRWNAAWGTVVDFEDSDDELRLFARTEVRDLARRVHAGYQPECSVGWYDLEAYSDHDEQGPLFRVSRAHLFELSIVQRAAIRGCGLVGYREVVAA